MTSGDPHPLTSHLYDVFFTVYLSPAQTVQILSMMEQDISSREAEVRTLRGDVDELKEQAEIREQVHETEIRSLSAQLEEAHGSVVSCQSLSTLAVVINL